MTNFIFGWFMGAILVLFISLFARFFGRQKTAGTLYIFHEEGRENPIIYAALDVPPSELIKEEAVMMRISRKNQSL